LSTICAINMIHVFYVYNSNWLYPHNVPLFTARHNARIASAVLPIAIPSVCLSVCLSVCPSVTRRYSVKTTARSTVQFALSDSKNVPSFVETKKNIPQGWPWNLGSDWPTPPDSSESWHLLPCSASTVRDRKRCSFTVNNVQLQLIRKQLRRQRTPRHQCR